MRILFVEDDNLLAQAVVKNLSKQNYVVDVAADGEAGRDLVAISNYDLILLDVMLPKLDGISLCQQLRQKGYTMPILLLTAKDTKTDKVMGLDAGADDYLVKPFDFQELSARIRALVRRGNFSLPPVLSWGDLRLDPSSCKVTYANATVDLTAKEFSLLELFLRNSQRTFSRSAIVDRLWGASEDVPEENTIKSHIKSLRQKLKAAGADYDFIETVYGMGYRLKPLPQEKSSQPQESEPTQSQTLLAAIETARSDFITGVNSRIAVLEQANNALKKGKLNSKLRQKAEQEAHKLVGALGSFGFPYGSLVASEIENLFNTQTPIDHSFLSLRLNKLLIELRRSLELLTVEQPDAELAFGSSGQNVLIVVSNDMQLIEQLVNEAATQKRQVKIATDPTAVKSAIAFSNPDVILILPLLR